MRILRPVQYLLRHKKFLMSSKGSSTNPRIFICSLLATYHSLFLVEESWRATANMLNCLKQVNQIRGMIKSSSHLNEKKLAEISVESKNQVCSDLEMKSPTLLVIIF